MPCPALAQNTYRDPGKHEFRVGVEGFQDKYMEDSVKLVEHARFLAGTLDYIHSRNGFRTMVQLRGSYGKDNYKSVSGTIRNIPQYEGEVRVLGGLTVPIGNVGGVKAIVPYFGLGSRYFYDNSKGTVTSKGFFGYDRRITQFYVPLGAMWSFDKWGFTFSSVAEFDYLVYGHVSSRFHNFDPDAVNLSNTQRDGYGLRGEFMLGQQYEDFSWQLGPFVRYWSIKDSKTDTVGGSQAGTYLEPKNSRVQTGAAFRVQF
ncbi:MAG: hypothetical protein EBV03_02330 [Proteobacteria bacterium]|nr:hypothetical protein [Pseudomonadota bacterium]